MMNPNSSETIFVGDSQMARLMRSHDWSQTPLGHVSSWTSSLKTAVSICLNSRFPMVIWWGKDLLLLYNDAWRPILGTKHPKALGKPGREVWAEIWDIIGVQLHSVLETAQATWSDDMLLPVDRYGYTEEAYFTYSYSPIFLETGEVGGAFTAVTETTRRVIGERRLSTLRELAANTVEAKSVEETCQIAGSTVANNPYDIPFALLYLVEMDGRAARLVQRVRIEAGTTASPEQVDLTQEQDCWNLAQVKTTGNAKIIDQLSNRFGQLSGGAWEEPSRSAIVLPIAQAGQKDQLAGLLVLGISPRREFDDEYRGFFDLVASNVATAIANARAYEEERKRAEALAEIDRAKTAFFSNVSHEFRTPLTLMLSPLEEALASLDEWMGGSVKEWMSTPPPIDSSTHLPLHPSAPPPIALSTLKEQLQLVQRNGLRLQKLVNTLLDFSRIEAGRVQASYEPTDLATYTAELASAFRSLIERAGMTLEIDCPALSEPVYIDRDMWEKIVLNLISNAFKFTFAGEIRVSLRESFEFSVLSSELGEEASTQNSKFNTQHSKSLNTQNSKFVILEVHDTGVGIPETELPRLFERFHRISGTRSRTYEGSGIGLALVQELVKLHGGTIRVTSEVDRGTTFTIALPLGSAHLPSDRIQATQTLASTGLGADPYVAEASRWMSEDDSRLPILDFGLADNSSRSNLSALNQISQSKTQNPKSKILLADDNADMRDYLKRLLSQQYEVETVADGIAALAAIRQQMPDLVLTDVMMPGMDGFGLLQELRSDPTTQDIPIILLSARAGEEARIEGLEAGADDYLTKPFSARELLARVEANLKLAQLRREATQREQVLNQQLTHRIHELQTLFNLLPVGVAIATDPECRTIRVNPYLSELIRVPIDINASQSAPPNERPLYRLCRDGEELPVENLPMQYAAMHNTEVKDEVLDLIHPDGTVVKLLSYCSPLLDEQGNVRGALGAFVDITQRIQNEEALSQSEARFRRIFECNMVPMGIWSRSGGILHANDALLDLIGYTRQELEAEQINWLTLTPPEWLPLDEASLAEIAVKGFSTPFEKEYIHKQGHRVPILIGGASFLDDPDSGVFLAVDLTERKQAEEALRRSEAQLSAEASALIRLNEASSRLWYRLSLNEGLNEMLAATIELLGADMGNIQILDSDRGGLYIAAHYGFQQDFLDFFREVSATDDSACGRTLRDGQRTIIADIEVDAPYAPFRSVARAAGYRAVQSTPLIGRDGELLGMLSTHWRSPHQPSEQDLRRLDLYVRQAADFIEHIRIETALRQSEERYRTLFESIDQGFCIIEMIFDEDNHPIDYRFLITNPAFDRQTGIENAEGRMVREIAPQHEAYWFEIYGNIALTGEARQFENWAEEFHRWYEVYAFRVGEPELKRVGVLFNDISDRKQTEVALRRSEEQLRAIFHQVIAGIAQTDLTGRLILVNQRYCDIVGYSRDELLHKRMQDITHPDDLPHNLELFHRMVTEGQGFVIEKRYLRKDGSHVWVSNSVSVIRDASGKPESAVAVVLDVTERKQAEEALRRSEERLRVSQELSLDAFTILDSVRDETGAIVDFVWTYVNPKAAEILKHPVEELVGQRLLEVLPGNELNSELFERYVRVVETGEPHDIELSYNADGITGWFRNMAVKLGDGIAIFFSNITERKQTEQALRQAEERLRVALQNAPITVFNQDHELKYTWIHNPVLHDLHEMLGKHDRDFLPSEDAEPLTAIKQRVLETGIGVREEIKVARDRAYHYDLTVEPLRDENNTIIGITCAAVDISKLKQSEINLRESEARFRGVVESNMVGILFWNASGCITDGNDMAVQMLGYSQAELRSGQVRWIDITPPEFHEIDAAMQDQLLTQGVCPPFEKAYIRKDGAQIPILIGGALIPGYSDRGVAYFLDISDRKQAEQERERLLQQEQTLRQQAEIAERRLYALLESIREDFVLLDRDWRVAYLNSQAATTLQKSRDEMLGRCYWDLFPNLVGTEFYDRLHQAMREQASVQFEYYYDTWDTWFENRVYPADEGIIVLCSNITDRVQIERDRERILQQEQTAREEAEAANRIKDEFLAVVSHELRSPLNPILGWSKLLRTRQMDKEKTDRALEVIERNAQMQAQLINDLLDVSRILRGKLSLDSKPVDLAATIQAAMETVRLAAEAKAIALRFEVGDGVNEWMSGRVDESPSATELDADRMSSPTPHTHTHRPIDPSTHPPIHVIGDAGRLQQVIWNLLTNAVKFTSEGGRVNIRLEQVRNEGMDGWMSGRVDENPSTHLPIYSYAQITITDTGKGIPADFLPFVFEQFRQESSATTRRFGGLGLGLAIVRYLVELHGGTVEADSPGEGRGATFTVKLPLMPHQPTTEPNPKPSEFSLNLQGTRILIVDDDDNTREFLAFLLELHGANVIATASASEALTTLTQFKPDVLLSDIGMPDVDGYMLMRQIRALSPEQGGQVPAIALTAYAGEIDHQQAMAAGFQRHIAKPLEPEVLIQAIATLLC